MPKVLGEKDATAIGGINLVKKNKAFTVQAKRTREYYVLADNASQTEEDILIATGIPPFLSGLLGAFCVSKEAREIATIPNHPTTGVRTILWEVTCEFDSDIDVEEADQPPEARTPKVRWYGENETDVLEKDAVTGEPILTAAGEQITVEGPVAIQVVEIRRFELPPFNPGLALDYVNHVNQSAFYGAPVGTALMLPVEASEEKVVDEVRVIEIAYRIKFKIRKDSGGGLESDTWKAKPLHQGYQYFKNFVQPVQTYTDDSGTPTLINLAADGTKLADGAPYVYLSFNRFPRADFNTLNLGPF